MKNYLLIKKLLFKSKEYIFIILTSTILLLISFSKSFSEENIFTVDNVEVEGKIGQVVDINLRYVTIESEDQRILVPNSISVSKVISVKR